VRHFSSIEVFSDFLFQLNFLIGLDCPTQSSAASLSPPIARLCFEAAVLFAGPPLAKHGKRKYTWDNDILASQSGI